MTHTEKKDNEKKNLFKNETFVIALGAASALALLAAVYYRRRLF